MDGNGRVPPFANMRPQNRGPAGHGLDQIPDAASASAGARVGALALDAAHIMIVDQLSKCLDLEVQLLLAGGKPFLRGRQLILKHPQLGFLL
jgi:hypothetical protein